jgi:hypothetical protein
MVGRGIAEHVRSLLVFSVESGGGVHTRYYCWLIKFLDRKPHKPQISTVTISLIVPMVLEVRIISLDTLASSPIL